MTDRSPRSEVGILPDRESRFPAERLIAQARDGLRIRGVQWTVDAKRTENAHAALDELAVLVVELQEDRERALSLAERAARMLPVELPVHETDESDEALSRLAAYLDERPDCTCGAGNYWGGNASRAHSQACPWRLFHIRRQVAREADV